MIEAGAGRRYDYALSVLANLDPAGADALAEGAAAGTSAEPAPRDPSAEAIGAATPDEAAAVGVEAGPGADDTAGGLEIDVDIDTSLLAADGGAPAAPPSTFGAAGAIEARDGDGAGADEGDGVHRGADGDTSGWLTQTSGANGIADVMAYAVSAAAEAPWEEPADSWSAPAVDGGAGEGSVSPESRSAVDAAAEPARAELPKRPPPGAPMVRPTVAPLANRPAFAEGELGRAASEASVITDPDGGTSFHITFRDDVFEDLSCRITMDGDRVVAVFNVQNQNLRRLLEAESGRLRAQLEGRGLRVGEVRVEVG